MADIDVKLKVIGEQAQSKLQDFSKAADNADKNVSKLQSSIKSSTGVFSTFAGTLGGIVAANTLGKIVSGFTDLIGSSVKVSGEIETLRAQFETLTGSAGGANKIVKELTDFAAATPFQIKELSTAAQKLLSFGFAADDITKKLQVLGDVSAASGADINELSLIFGQVQAAGKLTGERLLQLQERAIPIGPAIATTMGVAESSIKKLVSDGKVKFSDFEAAFESLNKQSGFAFDGMSRRAQTLEGRISTLKDNFELLKAEVGNKLQPAMKAITTALSGLFDKIRVSAELQQFLDLLASKIPQAIGFTFDSLQFLADAFYNTRKAINYIHVGFAIVENMAIDAAITFLKAGKYIDEFLNKFTDRSDYIKKQEQLISTLQLLKETASEQAENALADNDKMTASQEKLTEVIANGKNYVIDLYNKEIEAIKERDAAEESSVTKRKALSTELTAEEQKFLDQRKKNLEEIRVLEEANRILNTEAEFAFQDSRIIQLGEYFTLEQEARYQAQLNKATTEAEYEKIITDIQKEGLSKRLEYFTKSEEEKKKKLEESKKAQIELERTTNQAKAGLMQDFANLSTAVLGNQSKAAFFIQKAAAAAQIVVQGQIAEAGLAASLAPLGPAAIGSAVALQKVRTGIQLATVAAQTIQGFETGGVIGGNHYTGDKVLARVNSGEMILNRQQQANLFDQINSGSQGETIIHTNVVLDGEVVARAVSKQVANGFQLGEVQ